MRKRRAALVAAVVLAALVVAGWLWARPRAHIDVPTASASPVDVVRAYGRALDARDFDTCRRIAPTDPVTGSLHRWDWRDPRVRDLDVAPVATTSAPVPGWEQAAVVDATATLVDADGAGATRPRSFWTFTLVRHDDAHPWQILGQGSGG